MVLFVFFKRTMLKDTNAYDSEPFACPGHMDLR